MTIYIYRALWDVQADDVNIHSYAAVNPQWKTEPIWNISSNETKCAHKCDQQDCRSAKNCRNDCGFVSSHMIPQLCKMHWRILVFELDSDDDMGSSSSST